MEIISENKNAKVAEWHEGQNIWTK